MTKQDNMKLLREMLYSDRLEYIMEAHSGLSAVIAEEAGFKALWASGLSLSAVTGCKDRNELDLSEICAIIRQMSDHVSIPILVDGDTGGADILSAKNMVRKLYNSGASGVCIEDKIYPKHNSFLKNGADDLADPQFHANKIKVMKEEIPEFVVVARLESFIAGAGLEDALGRARLYAESGADAILVHSKKTNDEDIRAFMRNWKGNPVPVVVVPTKYYKVPTHRFEELGVSTVIWANHNLRASIKAMQEVSQTICQTNSLFDVEQKGKVVPVSEVFRLQKDDEAVLLESKYSSSTSGVAVLLCGGKDKSTGKFKSLSKPNNKSHSYLEYLYDLFDNSKVKQINVVLGHGAPFPLPDIHTNSANVTIHTNPVEDDVSEISSLTTAQYNEVLSPDNLPIYICYGDVYFKDTALRQIDSVDQSYDIVIASGVSSKKSFNSSDVLVLEESGCSIREELSSVRQLKSINRTTGQVSSDSSIFTGLIKVQTCKGLSVLSHALDCARFDDKMNSIIKRVLKDDFGCKIGVVKLYDDEWSDYDQY